MSFSTGQCHVAEVGSGKLELFHQAKMLRRFHVIYLWLEHKASAHHSSHQPRCSKSLEKMHRKKPFSLCSWIHPLKTAVFDFLSSIRQSITQKIALFLAMIVSPHSFSPFRATCSTKKPTSSRLQAPAGHPFWASQHEEVSGFTNFALSPALAPLS